ncbi:hypothetical protein DM01DRAFT_1304446 [Hesseltinella vesiculosa]|uniref:Zinc/iron permease n=1 Tax=Hesseltinella vesiculosa TaxID=101127 RepID=A0A1X2GKL4_9FUNG|nr:hypothetical protein DM01DRAFT_1304446 [Hesseltinella vesiculosa]
MDLLDNYFNVNFIQESNEQGWYLVLLSSLACVLGALVVFVDHSRIVEQKIFLSSSMSLGAGVLVFSSLASLLPAAKAKLAHQPPYVTYFFFLLGVLLTMVMTKFIHWCMPSAIHTCEMGLPTAAPSSPANEDHRTVLATPQSPCAPVPSALESNSDRFLPNYRYQLHPRPPSPWPRTNSSSSSNHHTMAHSSGAPTQTDVTAQQSHPWSCDNPDHPQSHLLHHHPSTYGTTPSDPHCQRHSPRSASISFSDQLDEKHGSGYFKIGMQTAIAICVHKFPEGLIMFMSGRTSMDIGVSVAASICIHNIIEGAMMAIPLYYASGSRGMAFLIAAVLGGASQPLGAVLGAYCFSRPLDYEREQFYFGISFALVSGMMLLIAIQSMLPQAIKAEPRFVSSFFFLGISLVGLASLLKTI